MGGATAGRVWQFVEQHRRHRLGRATVVVFRECRGQHRRHRLVGATAGAGFHVGQSVIVPRNFQGEEA